MGALVPILLQAAPFLADLIFGDKTGTVVQKAADIVGSALGADPTDPQVIQAALAKADPTALMALQEKLAEFAHDEAMARLTAEQATRQAEKDEMIAAMADVQNARGQTVQLAQIKSPLAYGAAIISFLVIVSFGMTVYLVFRAAIPPENREMAFYIIGQLSTFAGMVVAYFVGSTSGSMQKTQMMAGQSGGAPTAIAVSGQAPKA